MYLNSYIQVKKTIDKIIDSQYFNINMKTYTQRQYYRGAQELKIRMPNF